MNQRLVRALQRGGVAAKTQADAWSVWRSTDRRGRIIGSLSGADIEVLRLRNDLRPFGAESNQVLIWAGRRTDNKNAPFQATDLVAVPQPYARSLLEMLMTNCASQSLRERIRKACQQFTSDLEVMDRSGNAATMNWRGLAQGRRGKGQSVIPGRGNSHAQAARGRLAQVHSVLGDDDLSFLLKLVVREASRSTIAKAFALRPALAEQRGLSILRSLADTYGV
ncbi:MAG: hypothetical protein ACE37M_05485 [Henriciella sp.]